MKEIILALFLSVWAVDESLSANPIRRVVNMLQAMQKKVEAEGAQEEELYEKFQCYCKNNKGALTKSIAEAERKIAQLETQVHEDTAAKAQLDEELKNHKQDRADALKSSATATKNREKDAAEFAKDSGDLGTNVAGLGKAIDAIEKGLGAGAFLQTQAGAVVKHLVASNGRLSDMDRESVTAFLFGSASAPGSLEIVGILKEMKDEMGRDLKSLVEAEEQAKKQFEELSAAKKKEVAVATRAIERKTQRSGELAVKIVNGKDDLEDTQSALTEDQQFQVNLKKNCATKEKEMNTRRKTRAEESLALAETIKILNDDDALDLFKKTLPSPKQSFLQQSVTMKQLQRRARDIISGAAKTFKNPQLDFLALSLRGKKVDFSKIHKMIDDMIVTLGEEQKQDDDHKEYCAQEFDTSDDKKKEIERRIGDLTHEKEEADIDSKNLAAEIKALQAGIEALDKSVAEATELRKKEHAEFVETTTANQAAIDLIAFAKNRLNKFYNPKLYTPPPPRELSEEERVFSNFGGELEPTPAPGGIAGTGIGAFVQLKSKRAAPPPPPETFGAYSKKSEESGGVIAMIDILSNDLKKDTQEAELNEKDAQEEYEDLMADSQKKRQADSKSISTKETAKAEADEVGQNASDNLGTANAELSATKRYISNLHKDCDFLVENYDFRKTARAEEVDALKKGKAVLSGADYSFVQVRQHLGFLQA